MEQVTSRNFNGQTCFFTKIIPEMKNRAPEARKAGTIKGGNINDRKPGIGKSSPIRMKFRRRGIDVASGYSLPN